ncbi:hypothetical protein [Escherichia coli]|uniref:hypothetical protein n=1 Tax=Escherichia coli TaxID=562 RepID=UPI0009310B7D|nr:hypothetical protein [Escherichia coli]EFC7791304.1 hypothetical protein [Escherichia coli]EFE3023858.1 hypothetical protein [Escherichia coli]EFF9403784.1 hypothetical protein [Escherichia coli]EGL1110809.1 hypothetical protein [Escherichia coli]EGY1332478.1 hypothetical protein [Escherichia coli]
MAFHLHLRHAQLPKHIDTAPYPAPPGTITSTSYSSNQDPNAFLYELIRNKTAVHIEIFAKIVHEKSFFSTNPRYKYSSAPQYSTVLNLSLPPRTSDNGLKSLRPLATALLNKENLA